MRGRLLQRAVGVRENGEIRSFNNCHLACSNVKLRIFAKSSGKGLKKVSTLPNFFLFHPMIRPNCKPCYPNLKDIWANLLLKNDGLCTAIQKLSNQQKISIPFRMVRTTYGSRFRRLA